MTAILATSKSNQLNKLTKKFLPYARRLHVHCRYYYTLPCLLD